MIVVGLKLNTKLLRLVKKLVVEAAKDCQELLYCVLSVFASVRAGFTLDGQSVNLTPEETAILREISKIRLEMV